MRRTGREADLDGLELILVDGDNLLHAVRGRRDEAAVAWLLPQLVTWRPADSRIIVALDGHPAPGESARARVAPGIELQHARSRSADDLLIDLLTAQPYAQRARTAVVSSDRGLQARAQQAGGVTRSSDWLVTRLEAPSTGRAGGSTPVRIGRGRPGIPPDPTPRTETEREPWQPGRGATRKRGNPRRSARRGTRR